MGNVNGTAITESIDSPPVDGPFRHVTKFYSVNWGFTVVFAPIVSSDSESISDPEYQCTLWEAQNKQHYPPFIIVDRDSFFNIHTREAALKPLSCDEIRELAALVPSDVRQHIYDLARDWGLKLASHTVVNEETKKETSVLDDSLEKNPIRFQSILLSPVPRLKDPSYLKTFDWKTFVDSLTAYDTEEKDPRLRLVHKAHLSRGYNTRINPSAIEATNPGTSKSTHYEMAGQLEDKVTPSAFLGFAKSPKEKFPGVLDYYGASYWN